MDFDETEISLDNMESDYTIPIEHRSIKEYTDLFAVANQENSGNYLKEQSQVETFFEKNAKANDLIIKANCEVGMISEIRKYGLKLVLDRKLIDQDKWNDFEYLIGEAIRDALHSSDKKNDGKPLFNEPKFYVHLRNLNDKNNFSFEIINPDKTKCKDWKRVSRGEAINQAGENAETNGFGSGMISFFAESLSTDAQIKYIDIIGPDGNKEFTSFSFSANKSDRNKELPMAA